MSFRDRFRKRFPGVFDKIDGFKKRIPAPPVDVCQTSCEQVCELGCENVCEMTCELTAQYPLDPLCQDVCETAIEQSCTPGAACMTVTCETSCEFNYEVPP